MTPTPTLVEKMARSIYEAHRGEFGISRFHALPDVRDRAQRCWETLPTRKPEEYACVMAEARAALAVVMAEMREPSADAKLAGGMVSLPGVRLRRDGSQMGLSFEDATRVFLAMLAQFEKEHAG